MREVGTRVSRSSVSRNSKLAPIRASVSATAKLPAMQRKSPQSARTSSDFLELLSMMDVGAMRPEQALAGMLSPFYPVQEAYQIAHEVLDVFGDLENLLSASLEDTLTKTRISREVWYLLQVMKKSLCLVQRSKIEKRVLLNEYLLVFSYLSHTIGASPYESVRVLFLDTSNFLIKDELHSSGTLARSGFFPRDLITRCCELNASAIIIAHNHPSGNLEPSDTDIVTTKQIELLLDLIDVKLHDHMIVGRDSFFSFKRSGYLS